MSWEDVAWALGFHHIPDQELISQSSRQEMEKVHHNNRAPGASSLLWSVDNGESEG